MSTRANIILKEGKQQMIFYRHSDGYPEGTMPTLNKFVELMKSGKIRNNLSQGAGWLIFLGAIEYREYHNNETFNAQKPEEVEPKDWKIGAYEPTTCIHGDIEYLYTIDMDQMTIESKQV